MAEIELAAPTEADEIYVDEVAAARPVMQGDVYREVRVPGFDAPTAVMIVAHPCTIRGASGELRDRLAVCSVTQYQHVPFDAWPDGYYNVFPLPPILDGGHCAGRLDQLATVESAELRSDRRVLVLTDWGVYVLQQRFVHSLTRAKIGLDVLERASGHVLEEAALQEEWVDALAGDGDADEQIREFTALMDGGLREQLADPIRRSGARASVRRELLRRMENED